MKNNELLEFLKAIGFIDEKNLFAQAKYQVKYFHHNQQGVLTIYLDNFLPIGVLAQLENQLAKIKYQIFLDFKIKQTQYQFEEVKNYFNYIRIHKLKLLAGIFAELPWTVFTLENENLIIKVNNKTEANLITKENSNFLNFFVQFGFKKLKIKVNADYTLANIDNTESEVAQELLKVKFNNVEHKRIPSNTKQIDLTRCEVTCSLQEIKSDINHLVTCGQVAKITKFMTKNQKWFYTFLITDFNDAIQAKIFVVNNKQESLVSDLKINDCIKISGSAKYDSYAKEQVIWINDLIVTPQIQKTREDKAEVKRVEWHTHTKMSAMDGVTDASSYVKQAAKWKHTAIAFTDHFNLQAYPEISQTAKKFPQLKVIYGVEMEIIPELKIVQNQKEATLSELEYLVFDLETTGLSTNYNEIIEFGYVVVKNNIIIDQATILIKPEKPVPDHITAITNITNEMLEDEKPLITVIAQIQKIIKNRVLVAHNADFDMGFLQAAFNKLNLPPIENMVIDTLPLARVLKSELKYYRLGTVCRSYGVKYDGEIAHRADYDAKVLAEVFIKMVETLKSEHQVTDISKINFLMTKDLAKKARGEHVTIYAKNQDGLKSLYQLVSEAHTTYFSGTAKITKSIIDQHRKNLLIGSACANGRVFEAAMNKSTKSLAQSIAWFDFIEIQPPSVYQHLISKNLVSENNLLTIIKKIITASKKLNKIVIATSDAHYLNPQDKVFRSIIINNKAIGGIVHPLFDYKNNNNIYPDQHLRTTNEMLEEFAFLDNSELVKEIVITNTNFLAEQCQKVEPIKEGLFTPEIDNVETKLKDVCYHAAWARYGKNLPEIVAKRLEKELTSIITHGFAVVYWIAHKLVTKSLSDGYLVGSRGSVGSSLVATLANITEVNPLQPHYLCLKCHYFELISNGTTKCGYDLVSKMCPNCHHELISDGHDIPFETFLGFDGDKIPDIDLNFSGEYQIKAHDFTKEMFGENNVFRAGTISTVAAKTAYGFAKNYAEQNNLTLSNAMIEWLSQGCTGVKRTTGQHPGGIIVVPKKYQIIDFTPINYPADDLSSSWKTTHFDFEAIHDNLLKLDILGHVDPTALKMLYDLTGIDPITIPNHDEKVLSLFSSLKALQINSDDLNGETTGAIGIPEFGTSFVRKMLATTKPNSFAQLVQISGLSHGTDVWLNNAENLINKEGIQLKDVIGCRDDIMTYLVYQGLPSKSAFFIMEDVRKGKGLKNEYEQLMRKHHVPQWYIQSCQKIKYMFPKAHATAYVLMAWRVAWYKIYYPHEYYTTYFSTRCDIFEIETMLKGKKAISDRIVEINKKMKIGSNIASQKEKDLLPMLEVALEMHARGIRFANIDLDLSETKKFKIVEVNQEKVIVPPFITVDGLGEVNAQSIINARKNAKIKSEEDLKTRTSITKTNLKSLVDMGVIANLATDEKK